MADERIVDHDREVACHLELVAAAHADPVDARQGRLADLAKAVVGVLEGAEPLPVLAGLPQVVLRPGLQVGADAECPPGAGQHDDADLIVPGRVLACPRELPQELEVERVQHLRAVQRDRRPGRRLLVDDLLETELGRVARLGPGGLRHSLTSAKSTWKRPPISMASLPVAMNSSLCEGRLERRPGRGTPIRRSTRTAACPSVPRRPFRAGKSRQGLDGIIRRAARSAPAPAPPRTGRTP